MDYSLELETNVKFQRELILLKTEIRLKQRYFSFKSEWNTQGCTYVSMELEKRYGWKKVQGTFMHDGILHDHCWNILPDGRILDVTVDQFNEGDEIRITDGDDEKYEVYL